MSYKWICTCTMHGSAIMIMSRKWIWHLCHEYVAIILLTVNEKTVNNIICYNFILLLLLATIRMVQLIELFTITILFLKSWLLLVIGAEFVITNFPECSQQWGKSCVFWKFWPYKYLWTFGIPSQLFFLSWWTAICQFEIFS